jgi:hypothetical protein
MKLKFLFLEFIITKKNVLNCYAVNVKKFCFVFISNTKQITMYDENPKKSTFISEVN